jgi:hypothetical protein
MSVEVLIFEELLEDAVFRNQVIEPEYQVPGVTKTVQTHFFGKPEDSISIDL